MSLQARMSRSTHCWPKLYERCARIRRLTSTGALVTHPYMTGPASSPGLEILRHLHLCPRRSYDLNWIVPFCGRTLRKGLTTLDGGSTTYRNTPPELCEPRSSLNRRRAEPGRAFDQVPCAAQSRGQAPAGSGGLGP